jgi:hypothetical protein
MLPEAPGASTGRDGRPAPWKAPDAETGPQRSAQPWAEKLTSGRAAPGRDFAQYMPAVSGSKASPTSGSALSKTPSHRQSTVSTNGPLPVPSCRAEAYRRCGLLPQAPDIVVSSAGTTEAKPWKYSIARSTVDDLTAPSHRQPDPWCEGTIGARRTAVFERRMTDGDAQGRRTA